MTEVEVRPMTRYDAATGSPVTVGVGAPRLVSGGPRAGAPVAVCIPVYQGAEHLAETLVAVRAQTATDLEIVVLDNASTDGTAEVLAAHPDPRMTVWRNPVTVPMAENFNRAVALSHAPLVKVVAADDLVEPDCLERQVALLTADPTLAFVAGRKHLVDERGRVLARARFLRGLVGTFDRAAVLRRVVRSGANPIGGDVAVTFRRSAFRAAGGYRDGIMHADLDLWLRLLEHGRFRGEAATVARFRVRATSRSGIADAEDYAAQRRFTADVVVAGSGVVRRRDRIVGRVSAPLARRRRELIFAVVRLRARTRSSSRERW